MENIEILVFMKIGAKAHMEQLVSEGKLYLNPLLYFRKLEDNCRGDRFEGVRTIKNYPAGQLSLGGLHLKRPVEFLELQLRQSFAVNPGNIYSLYSVNSTIFKGRNSAKPDPRILDFGDTTVIIKDLPKFISKVKQAVKSLNLALYQGLVEYYDPKSHAGDVGIFYKPFAYEYQNEFRFFVERQADDPLILNIGSLENITEVHPTKTIIESFKAFK